jgi:hypothetical protein
MVLIEVLDISLNLGVREAVETDANMVNALWIESNNVVFGADTSCADLLGILNNEGCVWGGPGAFQEGNVHRAELDHTVVNGDNEISADFVIHQY